MIDIIGMIKKRKDIVENYLFLSLSTIFILLYPLITYPYLIKVLGQELYGVILTSQMLAAYASILVNFGTNHAVTRHVSFNRNDQKILSSILCNVISLRFCLFVAVFVLYFAIVLLVPMYREYWLLFVLMYGFVSQDFLYPRFFFQGIEKMKFTSMIDIIIKLVFIPLIFIMVHNPGDYLWVPIIYTFGFFISGIVSLLLVKNKFCIQFTLPTIDGMKFYLKDSLSLFATDMVCTIKDKFSYFLIGASVGMSELVIYDLCLKLSAMVSKPFEVLASVMFPRVAQTRSIKQVYLTAVISFTSAFLLCLLINIFLDDIVAYFLCQNIDLLPIRVFLLSPIILSVSMIIANVMFVGFGYNKYLFYSIVVTTIGYLTALLFFFFTGQLNSIMSFVYIAVFSYTVELIYRFIKAKQISGKLKATIV